MTNAVVVIVIGKSEEWKVSKPSVVKYCEKYGLCLEIMTQLKYGVKIYDPITKSINTFEKNQVYDLFDKYDRILRLDYDIIITPNCPNIFDVVPKDMIGGVYEDVGVPELNRKGRIINIQKHLGDLNWNSGYLNAGVVIASKQHKEIFNTSIEEINMVQEIEGIITPEQDYLNYMIKKLGFEVYSLNYKFNHIIYFKQNRFDSYIIHYAGSKVFDRDLRIKQKGKKNRAILRELSTIQMKRDYKVLY